MYTASTLPTKEFKPAILSALLATVTSTKFHLPAAASLKISTILAELASPELYSNPMVLTFGVRAWISLTSSSI